MEGVKTMLKIISAFKQVLGIIWQQRPWVAVMCTFLAILSGLLSPLAVWINGQVIDLGLAVAAHHSSFKAYVPYLILFGLSLLLPQIITTIKATYLEPATELVFSTSFKEGLIRQLEKMRYEHLENEQSLEVIDKTFHRLEESATHLFPNYFFRIVSASISLVGILVLFSHIRWWLALTLLLPFLVDIYFSTKDQFDIYEVMDSYWQREQGYRMLGKMLRTRKSVTENQLLQASDYLVATYQSRLEQRNKEFERYYLMNLKRHFLRQNITRFSQLLNAGVLLALYFQGALAVGVLLALTMAIFSALWEDLYSLKSIFKHLRSHAKTFDYYQAYLQLSQEQYGTIDQVPTACSVEFEDVCFAYPGTRKQILKHVSFKIEAGEKVALVGQNAQGKSTIIKLLLGLFKPDSGQIRIGGHLLSAYSQAVRESLFGTVFQDLNKYDISLADNIGLGEVSQLGNSALILAAIKKAKLEALIDKLPQKGKTLLSREFTGGVDLSGGQWQRVAIARAFMGEKPLLILDEPTSQMDPLVESQIYSDFLAMSEQKTVLLVTHRLGATKITDRILVFSGGAIIEAGTHEDLMVKNGLYAEMFKSQKQWYEAKKGS
jgi:ATP-binding cassette subfamily B protein